MAIVNRYRGFDNTVVDPVERLHDSDFGESKTRDFHTINKQNQVSISNSYNSYNNRFGASTNYNANELRIVQNMVSESINHNGITVRYMPRKSDYTDEVWNETPSSQFDRGLQIDMYLESTSGFEGEGDIMTQYGIEFREEVIMRLSIPRFEDLYGDYQQSKPDYERVRPLEGDLIVIPFGISSLNRNQYVPKFFEITRVTTYHDGAFFQMGDNYQYKIQARLFELSYEQMGFTPKVDKTLAKDSEIIVVTKPEQLEAANLVADPYINITNDPADIPDKYADNHAIEVQSQERVVHDNDGKELKDKPKVMTKDYTAKAFGYSQGVINDIDEI